MTIADSDGGGMYQRRKQRIAEMISPVYSFGFSLIIGSILYFIIGSVVEVVHGNILHWTFCGSAHYLFGVQWCGIGGEANASWFDHFFNRMLNIPLPWFLMFWGVVLVCFCATVIKLVGQQRRRLHDSL